MRSEVFLDSLFQVKLKVELRGCCVMLKRKDTDNQGKEGTEVDFML